MSHATITGWGKCLPPAVLRNADVATFLDTSDDWIVSRSGVRERRISHVGMTELARVAGARALAAAGLAAADLELVIVCSCSSDEFIPNVASSVQRHLEAWRAGAMDLNSACVGFIYGLTVAQGLIQNGVVRNVLLIGAEQPSRTLDWTQRDMCVLFGDGAGAVVLEATDQAGTGVVSAQLGCDAAAQPLIRIHNWGLLASNRGAVAGLRPATFEGREVFRHAVVGMAEACEQALAKADLDIDAIDLVVPHQANLRIIEAVGKRLRVTPERVFVNVDRYGNMYAATIPVALTEAVESGRLQPGATVLLTGFGAGLTVAGAVLRWGVRTQPVATSPAELPSTQATALELLNQLQQQRGLAGLPVR